MTDALPINQQQHPQQGTEGARRLLRSSSSSSVAALTAETVPLTAVRRPRTRLLPPSSLEEEEEELTSSARRAVAAAANDGVVNLRNPCEISNDAPEGQVVANSKSIADAQLAVCGTSHYQCQPSSSTSTLLGRQRQQQEPLIIPFAYDIYYFNNDKAEQQGDEHDNLDATSIMAYVGESILNQGAAAMQLLDCATKSIGDGGGGGGGGERHRQYRKLVQERLLLAEYHSSLYSQQQQDRLLVSDFTPSELERFIGLALQASGQGIRSEGCSSTSGINISSTSAAAAAAAPTDCLPVQSALTVYLQLSEEEAANGVDQIPATERLAIQESILSFLQTQMENDVYIVPNSITKVAYVAGAATPAKSSDTATDKDQNHQEEAGAAAIADHRSIAPSSKTSSNGQQTIMLIAAGACLLALVVFAAYFLAKRNKQNKKKSSRSATPLAATADDVPGTPSMTTSSSPRAAPLANATTATTTCATTALTCGGGGGGGNDKGGVQSNQKTRRWGLANRDSLALVPQDLEDVNIDKDAANGNGNGNHNDADQQSYHRRTDSSSSEGVPPVSVVGAEYMVDHIDIDDGLSGFTMSTGARSETGRAGGGDGNRAVGGPSSIALSMSGDRDHNGKDASPPPISTFSVSLSEGGFGTASSGLDDCRSASTYDDDEDRTDSLAFIAEVRTSTTSQQLSNSHRYRYHRSSSNDTDMQHNLEHDEVLSTTSYDTKKSAAKRVLQMS